MLLQTGQKTVFERALESKLALAEAQATRTSQLSMGQEFWDTMHARTASVMSAQEDCGVPGGCVLSAHPWHAVQMRFNVHSLHLLSG